MYSEACLLTVEVHARQDLSDAPPFDPKLGQTVCPAYLATAALDPSESIAPDELRFSIDIRWLAGASLSSGRYYLRVATGRLDGQDGTWPRVVSIPAGSVTFVR